MTATNEGLPRLFTAAEVAAALGQTEAYVKERCRRREWPHRRGARGAVAFTADDYEGVLEVMRRDASEEQQRGLSFAPRAKRGAA